MVRLRLNGGLGNQLFQWQAAVFIGLKLDENILIDCRGILGNPRDPMGILGFSLPFGDKISYKFGLKHLSSKLNYSIRDDHRFSVRMNSKIVNIVNEDPREKFPSRLLIDHSLRNTVLTGFFQSNVISEMFQKMFFDISTIELRDSASPDFVNLRDQILKDDPIILHVRRGDYLKLQTHLGVLSPNYYIEALDRLDTQREQPIYIFSDSLDLVKSEFARFTIKNDLRYVDSHKLTAAHLMKLMSLGRYHVISNSTFSWWSAFLSHSSDVVAPSQFYRNEFNHDERYPRAWKTSQPDWI